MVYVAKNNAILSIPTPLSEKSSKKPKTYTDILHLKMYELFILLQFYQLYQVNLIKRIYLKQSFKL